ncbi:MAG: hypothetical protein A3H71_03305 [Candidatus Sungbacteria bacterium RIFCSPLOWO2_02_FULL_48_13b]|uniref:Peptidase S8/S53 domain-containing protein n=1 Tax=Candidatus Sungbacteria bacterium RIFCSPLOWO2_02_FULL_48_13b TaxID=1802283 RepID=A0A1G2LJM7_9BACT|nr:MAG: hypothetical protein A3H71_03305 [Candidatus Sungbacteria bacterium RIFCSPLOWO2_02_FULL_48_13b]
MISIVQLRIGLVIFVATIFLALLAVLAFGSKTAAESPATSNNERKIVVFKGGTNGTERDAILGNLQTKRIKRLHRAIDADVLDNLNAGDIEALKQNPKVVRIDDDVTVFALRKPGGDPAPAAAQVLPWGIDRIDAELVWPTGNTANPIKVGVIDTGISSSHPDLATNIKGGYNAINSRKSYNDDNGHGSHVAGIIAAINNSTGVVGAAPQTDLYAIKVLNAAGSGYLSDVIEGIDWAITRGIQVTNMSLGTSADVQSMHDAIIRARNAGIVQVAAAGNDANKPVIYPAAYPEVIAISATDSTNTIASWSSRGPEVDLTAPGVSIYSTYKGTGYATLSGTSMASPHVAGAAALLINTPVGSHDANSNGRWDPDEVQTRLQATATDLGAGGFDPLYGWGLVNAWAAVQ